MSRHEPLCGVRVGKLSKAARAALPSKAFGLPESRRYPMPDAQHAAAALGLAKTHRKKLTDDQYKRVTRKARRVLKQCGAIEVKFLGNPGAKALQAVQAAVAMGKIKNGDTVDVLENPTNAERAYAEFHWGRKPSGVKKVNLPDYSELYVLGDLRQVEYATRKGETKAIWYHDFSKPYPKLTATPDGRLGPIVGGACFVTSRGIEQ